MLSLTYYDADKNIIPKISEDKAKYARINNGIVLKKIWKEIISLPYIYWEVKSGNYIILSGKENVVSYLKKNIKQSWWDILWYKFIKDWIIEYWTYKKWKQEITYEIEEKWKEINLNQAKALKIALRNLHNELELPDKMIDTKNLIDEVVNPSKIIALFFSGEYEKWEITYSDTKNIIIDIKNTSWNISWTPFDCLYRKTQWIITELNNYVSKLGIEELELSDMFYVYNYKDWDRIEFRTDWVYRNKMVWDNEAELNIINKGIKLIWYVDTDFNIERRVLTDKVARYYYIEVGWEKELIWYNKNPDTFNSRNWNNWLRFLETNKTLQIFYNWLDDWIEKENIQKYELMYENKLDLDKKIWVHWWQVIYNDSNINYINYTPEYAIDTDREQISLKEVYNKLDWYYKKPYHHLIMLWLLWAWLKPEFNKRKINIPLMLCSWYTESWKTEMIKMIMWLFGYAFNSTDKKPRLLSLEWTTSLPVVRSLTDLAPIFFDELTGSVKKEVEEILRSVFNNQNIEKWNADQSVTIYIQQAPVIIWGERLPSYQSVLNRSIYLPFSTELRWTKNKYLEIKSYLSNKTVIEDVWNLYKNIDIDNVIKKVWKAHKGWRVQENYMFLRYINAITNYMPEDELEDVIKELLERQDSVIQWTNELTVFFNSIIVYNKNNRTYIMTEENWELKIGLFVPEEYVRTKAQYIQDIKKLVYDNINDNSNIFVNMSRILKEKNEESKVLFDTIIRFFRGTTDPVWTNFLSESIGVEEF